MPQCHSQVNSNSGGQASHCCTTAANGDRVFVDKRAYGFRIPFTNVDMIDGDPVRRGDIVIFDSPRDGRRLIKRIVAVGGDRV
ncbi:MAG: hypothetical protein IH913_05330, partial [Proteobacteria bacterium]|nr:hypothetical protein [Pseudomonadota bacterium]